MNYELDQLIHGVAIIWFIKGRGLEWLGHVRQMDDSRTSKRVIGWKPIGRRIRGRLRKRWLDDSENNLRSINVTG